MSMHVNKPAHALVCKRLACSQVTRSCLTVLSTTEEGYKTAQIRQHMTTSLQMLGSADLYRS